MRPELQVRKDMRTHWLLEMAVISTTSRFAVDEVSRISGVSDLSSLLERLGGGHSRSNRGESSEGNEDVELHVV
jgi:hypothetical protein